MPRPARSLFISFDSLFYFIRIKNFILYLLKLNDRPIFIYQHIKNTLATIKKIVTKFVFRIRLERKTCVNSNSNNTFMNRKLYQKKYKYSISEDRSKHIKMN